MENVGTIMAIVILFVSAIYDWKTKTIPLKLLIFGVLGGLIWLTLQCVAGSEGITFGMFFSGIIRATLPGLGLIALSLITERKIGLGDGLLVLSVSLLEGGSRIWVLLCLGLFFQSLYAVSLILCKKAKKDTLIPFAPFLFCARVILFRV